MSHTVKVHCAAIPTVLDEPIVHFSKLEGQEGLGNLFKYVVTLKSQVRAKGSVLSKAANMNLREMIGKEMTIEIELDGSGMGSDGGVGRGKREISGIVTAARFLGNANGAAVYECELAPWLWLLTRRSNFKRYENKNVLDILDEVFSGYAYPVEKRLGKTDYPVREYQVQYGETDYNFAVRLMQEWGIYYHFQHREGKHVLVLCDGLTSHAEYDSAAYRTLKYHAAGAKIDTEHIDQFALTERLRTGSWLTSDFDFTRPKADLSVRNEQPRETAHNELKLFEWPGNYTDIAEGEEIARIRMEERRAKGSRATGAGNLRAVVPGYAFSLVNHPHETCNQKYLVLHTEFTLQEIDTASGADKFTYRVEFEVQPVTEVFRPARTLKKPKAGPLTATVLGPVGSDIWTDEYGRVLIEYNWEVVPGKAGNLDDRPEISTFVRVSYPWAGNNFGAIHIPRVGQEVIVQHINDDPDRPVVVGRLYNQLHMPPWELPANATQSGILTRSSEGPTGGGTRQSGYQNANALRFEDKKGAEQVWLHAEKDLLEEIENDRTIGVDGYDKLTVKKDKFTKVYCSSFECVTLLKTVTVGAAMQTTVGGAKNETVALSSSEQVGFAKNSIVGAERSDNIGGFHFVNVGLYQQIIVGGARTVTVGGAYAQNVVGAMETGVGGFSLEKVGLSKTVLVGGLYAQNVVGAMETGVGGFSLEKVGLNKTVAVGGAMETAVAAASTESVGLCKTVTVGKELIVEAGALLQLKCGGSTITMTPGSISISSGAVSISPCCCRCG